LDALRQLKRKRWKENANNRENLASAIKEAKVFRGQQILPFGMQCYAVWFTDILRKNIASTIRVEVSASASRYVSRK
jgi:hypothetical protein